jgi:hypothetical protein
LGNLPFQILLENVITLTPQERLRYLCISGFFHLRGRTNARSGF